METTLTTTPVAEMTPAEIDTVLAALWRKQAGAETDFRYWAGKVSQLQKAQAPSYRLDEAREQRAAANTKVLALEAEAEPYNLRYAVQPWNRYFLVTNANGHVHRGMDCTTCFPTTEFAWLPELSDCDEAVMVDEFGEKACTVCFPDAPALPAFAGPGRRDREAIEARQQEKQAREAAKAAKAITAPDGGPLVVPQGGRYSETYRTKVAARNALSSAVNAYGWYGPSHSSDFVGQAVVLIEALEAAGVPTAPVIERAVKRVRKEGGTYDITDGLAAAAVLGQYDPDAARKVNSG